MSRNKRSPLQSEIIVYIKEYIEKNHLTRGDKLPSQSELIETLQVSRSSLRESLKTLEAKNVLEVINGKGIYVNDGNPNIISASIEFRKEKESILELLEARQILEREILNLVILKATEEELDGIDRILQVLMAKYKLKEKQNEEDRAFHLEIYKCCHNRVMQQLMLSIDSLLAKLWDYPLGMHDPFTSTIPLHEELFSYIRLRDVKRAQHVNDRILQKVCEDIRRA